MFQLTPQFSNKNDNDNNNDNDGYHEILYLLNLELQKLIKMEVQI